MRGFINEFKIPTLLGVGIIVAGISSGVFLVVRNQNFFTKASPSVVPQNIMITNIEDTQVTISWQTPSKTTSFLNFGINNLSQQTVLDDRDTQAPKERFIHYATIKNLLPDTTYFFKIISGNSVSEIKNFKTPKPPSFQNGFGPIIGTFFEGDKPLDQALAYLAVSDASIRSANVKNFGNFLIPISLMRKADLSDTFQPKEDDLAKLTIIASSGQANALFKIKSEGVILPPIYLGQNLDLTTSAPSIPQPTIQQLNKFDFNEDKQINALDYSEVLLNFGKNPKNPKADLNTDGVVDQIDTDLLLSEFQKAANE